MEEIESVRSVLRELTCRRELTLWTTEAQYRQWLNARCPNNDYEIDLILLAIRHEVIGEMQRLSHGLTPSVLLPKLTRWLSQQSGLCPHEAVWAVESWAMALGIIEFSDSSSPHHD